MIGPTLDTPLVSTEQLIRSIVLGEHTASDHARNESAPVRPRWCSSSFLTSTDKIYAPA